MLSSYAKAGVTTARRNSVALVRVGSLALVRSGGLGYFTLEALEVDGGRRLLHLKLPTLELVSLPLVAPGAVRGERGLFWEWTGDERSLTVWPLIERPGGRWLIVLGRLTALPRRSASLNSGTQRPACASL